MFDSKNFCLRHGVSIIVTALVFRGFVVCRLRRRATAIQRYTVTPPFLGLQRTFGSSADDPTTTVVCKRTYA